MARERHDGRVQRVVEECRQRGVPVRFVTRDELDRLAHNAPHQGVVAVVSAKEYIDLEDLWTRKRAHHALLVVLDGVEDPHNLGAIIRTADGAGADGVVVPERRAVGVTATVAKASADLRTTLENKDAPADDIKTKLAALRDAREKARAELQAAQKELKEVLTQRQEAVLVTNGMLE